MVKMIKKIKDNTNNNNNYNTTTTTNNNIIKLIIKMSHSLVLPQ